MGSPRCGWKRLGFTDEVAASLSDRLIDALIAWGDPGTVAERVQAHRDAGADHVCVQVVAPPGDRVPLDDWRCLAHAVV